MKPRRPLDATEAVAGAHAAWLRLCPKGAGPTSIEVLSRKKKSTVCRLRGPARAGFPVVAKRTAAGSARIERALYERILPCLRIGSLGWRGMVDEPGGSFRWLFLEDAGDTAFAPERPEHRRLAALWLAAFHTAGVGAAQTAGLRECGARDALERLRTTRERLRVNLDDPMLGARGRKDLAAILRLYDAVEARWEECEAHCAAIPRALVHGDFAKKNLRVRERRGASELLVLDWEHAGVGFPGIDVAVVDAACYARAVRERWSDLDDRILAGLLRIGRLFRCLDAIDWESRCLGRPVGTSRETDFGRLGARLGAAVRESFSLR